MTESRQLLVQYAKTGSEAAFGELVTRYINLVYSTALRLVGGDTQLAEDVTQTVFIDLARMGKMLSQDVLLGGWLHQHAFHLASTVARSERRRRAREREASEMNMPQDNSEAGLSNATPLLDEAITQLPSEDRTAILLRFFEPRDFRSVGEALGTSEDAARMRVSRALDKLHGILRQRGVTLSAAALGTALTAEAVVAAPAGLAVSVTATAVASAAAVGGGIGAAVVKHLVSTKAGLLLIAGTVVLSAALLVLSRVPNRTTGRLRDRAHVVLEKVDYGTTYSPPEPALARFLRALPPSWLRRIHWHPGSGHGGSADRDIFTFWLKFSSRAAAAQPISYALTDERGFEAGMIFGGPYGAYQPWAFGTNYGGLVRGAGVFPRRSKNLRLGLYQQDGGRKLVRVAEFPVRNPGFRTEPTWKPQPLPIDWQTNGLVLTLVKATVGIAPAGPVLAPMTFRWANGVRCGFG